MSVAQVRIPSYCEQGWQGKATKLKIPVCRIGAPSLAGSLAGSLATLDDTTNTAVRPIRNFQTCSKSSGWTKRLDMDFPLSNLTSGSSYIIQNAGTGSFLAYTPSNNSLSSISAPISSDPFFWTTTLQNSSSANAPYFSIQLANTANCLGVSDSSIRLSPCTSTDLPQWKILPLIQGSTPPALVMAGYPAPGQLDGYVIGYADAKNKNWILGMNDTSNIVVSPVTPVMQVSFEGKGDASNVTLGGGDYWGLSFSSLEGKPGGISVGGSTVDPGTHVTSSSSFSLFSGRTSSPVTTTASTTKSAVVSTAADGAVTTLADAGPTSTLSSTTGSKTGAASSASSGVFDSFFWATAVPFLIWLI